MAAAADINKELAGEPPAVVAAAVAVTSSQQVCSEEELLKSLEPNNLPRLLLILQTTMGTVPSIVFVHENFEKMTKYSRQDALGQPYTLLHGPFTSKQAFSMLNEVLQQRTSEREIEMLNYTKDRQPFINRFRTVPLQPCGSRVVSHVAFVGMQPTFLRWHPHPNDWSPFEVSIWLELVDLGRCAEAFISHVVTGSMLLSMSLAPGEIVTAKDDLVHLEVAVDKLRRFIQLGGGVQFAFNLKPAYEQLWRMWLMQPSPAITISHDVSVDPVLCNVKQPTPQPTTLVETIASIPTLPSAWNIEQSFKWIQEQFLSRQMDVSVASVFKEQEINGEVLITLTEQDFRRAPFNLKLGPARILAQQIKELPQRYQQQEPPLTAKGTSPAYATSDASKWPDLMVPMPSFSPPSSPPLQRVRSPDFTIRSPPRQQGIISPPSRGGRPQQFASSRERTPNSTAQSGARSVRLFHTAAERVHSLPNIGQSLLRREGETSSPPDESALESWEQVLRDTMRQSKSTALEGLSEEQRAWIDTPTYNKPSADGESINSTIAGAVNLDLIEPVADCSVEYGSNQSIAAFPPQFDDPWRSVPIYQRCFLGTPHTNFVGAGNDTTGPVIVSVEDSRDGRYVRAVIFTLTGETRTLLPARNRAKALEKLPQLAGIKLTKITDPNFTAALTTYETRLIENRYKIGILYCRDGQGGETHWYNHVDESQDLADFLQWIGERVPLLGWNRYSGGLTCTTSNTDGQHSVFATLGEVEIMFHVSTYLPFVANEPQQLGRKRHIGNDSVVILFRDEQCTTPFVPTMICSQYNQVFCVIQPDRSGGPLQYRVACCSKRDVPSFGPPLPLSGRFCPLGPEGKNWRDWLLTKLINGERAVLQIPEFRNRMQFARRILLAPLVQEYVGAKK